MLRYFTGLILLLFLAAIKTEAQPGAVQNPDQFVFPEFSIGIMKMKNQERTPLALNYNVVTERMVFRQKNQLFDVINYSLVDTVYINQRKFVPFENVFYEVLVSAPVSLFIQHKGKIRTPPRPAAYGGTSEVSSSTYINNLQLNGDVYRMGNGEPVIIEPDPIIWIRKDDKMFPVLNKNSLLKIFSDRKNEIKEFITAKGVDPKNPGHLIGVVNYYNGLLLERMP